MLHLAERHPTIISKDKATVAKCVLKKRSKSNTFGTPLTPKQPKNRGVQLNTDGKAKLSETRFGSDSQPDLNA